MKRLNEINISLKHQTNVIIPENDAIMDSYPF